MKTFRSFLLQGLFVLCCAGMLQAQMTDGRPRFGLKMGVNGTSFYDDATADDIKSRIGIIGGGFVQIPFNKGRMAIRPEVLFATKGAEYTYASIAQSDIKFSYVQIPVSVEYRLLGFLNLHAGLHAAWLADANGKITGLPLNFDKEDFESFDYGWQAGAGLDIGNLGLHFRFERGLQNITKDFPGNTFAGDLKNSAWSLALSYGF